MKKGTRYHQLSYEERVTIAVLRAKGENRRSIATTLCRSPNTIAHELHDKEVNGQYIPKKAQHKTYWRRYRSKRNCLKVALSRELSDFVEDKLLLGWSPERIAGYAKRFDVLVSKKAIYKYVHHWCLEKTLFWRKIKKHSGPKRSARAHHDTEKRSIDLRSPLDGTGHWELDFIVSRQSSTVLLVMVDRWSRKTIIRRLEHKTHGGVLHALQDIASRYRVDTITTDNDIVFKKWKEMEELLVMLFYFCKPYHSWEKGLVENTNRWIRCFVPKKRDIATVTDDELRSIETFLNETPRQCLGYKTGNEVWLEQQTTQSTFTQVS